MITAQVESLTECLDSEIKPLLMLHWNKLALNKDKVPLDPQYETYLIRDARDEVLFISLRDKGKMIGYWVAFIAPGLHYKTCLTHTMDIWNVLPEYEMTMAPLILFRAVEREIKRRGVNRSFIGEKLHRPSGRLFKAFGYEPVETYYSKWIQND